MLAASIRVPQLHLRAESLPRLCVNQRSWGATGGHTHSYPTNKLRRCSGISATALLGTFVIDIAALRALARSSRMYYTWNRITAMSVPPGLPTDVNHKKKLIFGTFDVRNSVHDLNVPSARMFSGTALVSDHQQVLPV